VNFMGNGGGQLSQSRHARDAQELRLSLLQLRFGSLAGGEIADDADEHGLAFLLGLANGKVDRERRPVFASANNFTADADDLGFAGFAVLGYVVIVSTPVWLRHRHLDVFADDLSRRITE